MYHRVLLLERIEYSESVFEEVCCKSQDVEQEPDLQELTNF